MSPEPAKSEPLSPGGRLPVPPERPDPPPFTAAEIEDIKANGVSLDEIIRVIEAEGT